jgi:hypothetical protein
MPPELNDRGDTTVLIRTIAIASAAAFAIGPATTSNAQEGPRKGTSGASTKATDGAAKKTIGAPKPGRTPRGGFGSSGIYLNGTHLTGVALGETGGLGSAAMESVVLPDSGTAGR